MRLSMLKTRVIPTILWNGASSVKGEQFNTWRNLGPIGPAINIYVARDVDEIFLINLAPHKIGSEIDYQGLKRFFSKCNLPLTYGGGIKNEEQVERLLECGVDKISLNSVAYENKDFVSSLTQKYGSQFIVVSIDYKVINGKLVCFSNCGRKNEGIELTEHISDLSRCNIGEIMLTCIDTEGTMEGYETTGVSVIRDLVDIPIIISGGAGNLEHFETALVAGADALAASSAFLFTEVTPKKVKAYLKSRGHEVRL